MRKLSESIEDYIEHIYCLNSEKGVRITDLAVRMNVTKASATDAVKKLVDFKYVKHQKYGNVFITKLGEGIAKKILEKHNIITKYLIEVLGVDPVTAETDACKIEHIISETTFSKLKEKVE
ncbi:metal-dependent transcriptional regulator [Mycoplasmatota bacterium WC44]